MVIPEFLQRHLGDDAQFRVHKERLRLSFTYNLGSNPTLRFSGERAHASSDSNYHQRNARPSPLQAQRWVSPIRVHGLMAKPLPNVKGSGFLTNRPTHSDEPFWNSYVKDRSLENGGPKH